MHCKLFQLLLLVLLVTTQAKSQMKEIKLVGGCALDEIILPGRIMTDDIDELTNAAILNLVKGLGIQRTFTIRKAMVKNAAVGTDDEGNKLLLVNPEFLRNLRGHSSDWPVYFVLAHEIGHLLNNDPLNNENHTKAMETAADKFAAVTLCRMGAKLEEVKLVIDLFVKNNISAGYPTKEQRLFAIESGWADANCDNNRKDPLTYNAKIVEGNWQYIGLGHQIGFGAGNNRKYYSVCLEIKAASAEINRISKVRYYFLHDTFGEGGSQGSRYDEVTTPGNNFQTCLRIWGTFPLRIVIYYKEGKEIVIDHNW